MTEHPNANRVLMLALRRALLLIVKAIEEVYGKADPEPNK